MMTVNQTNDLGFFPFFNLYSSMHGLPIGNIQPLTESQLTFVLNAENGDTEPITGYVFYVGVGSNLSIQNAGAFILGTDSNGPTGFSSAGSGFLNPRPNNFLGVFDQASVQMALFNSNLQA